MIRIENWSVVLPLWVSEYTPPECFTMLLHGEVYGHPKFEKGHRVTTSAIVSVEGRQVKTESGSTYLLGAPSPQYMEWCVAGGHHVPTEEIPIKFTLRGSQ